MRDDPESQALLESVSQQGVIAEAAVSAFQGMYPIFRGHSNFGMVLTWPRALTFRGNTMRVLALWTGNQITTPKGQFDRSAVEIRMGRSNYIRLVVEHGPKLWVDASWDEALTEWVQDGFISRTE
jgi:hypothetical protein